MKVMILGRDVLEGPTKLLKNLRYIGAYFAFVDSGSTKEASKLETAMAAFAKPEDFAHVAEEMLKIPALQEMFENWYIPPKYTLEDLKQYKPGTLGYAYYRHMKDNGLGIDYYPVPAANDALGYFRMRAVQTHDIWHVLAGFAPVPAGEMGILHFNMGHYSRHLEHLATSMLSLQVAIASGGMLNIMSKHSESLIPTLQQQGKGFESGFNAKSLFAGQWESWFDRPLAELRQLYNITPANPVYDFEPQDNQKELVAAQ